MLIAKRQYHGVSSGQVLLERCVLLPYLVDYVLAVFKVGIYGAALGVNGSFTERHRSQPNVVAPILVLGLWSLINTRKPGSKHKYDHFKFSLSRATDQSSPEIFELAGSELLMKISTRCL
jgi:hypothetical protein